MKGGGQSLSERDWGEPWMGAASIHWASEFAVSDLGRRQRTRSQQGAGRAGSESWGVRRDTADEAHGSVGRPAGRSAWSVVGVVVGGHGRRRQMRAMPRHRGQRGGSERPGARISGGAASGAGPRRGAAGCGLRAAGCGLRAAAGCCGLLRAAAAGRARSTGRRRRAAVPCKGRFARPDSPGSKQPQDDGVLVLFNAPCLPPPPLDLAAAVGHGRSSPPLRQARWVPARRPLCWLVPSPATTLHPEIPRFRDSEILS